MEFYGLRKKRTDWLANKSCKNKIKTKMYTLLNEWLQKLNITGLHSHYIENTGTERCRLNEEFGKIQERLSANNNELIATIYYCHAPTRRFVQQLHNTL